MVRGRVRDVGRGACTLLAQVLWPVRPKLHYLGHLPDQANLMNPRGVRNYVEESGVGHYAHVYHSATNGPYEAVVQRTVLLKHMLALQLQFAFASV